MAFVASNKMSWSGLGAKPHAVLNEWFELVSSNPLAGVIEEWGWMGLELMRIGTALAKNTPPPPAKLLFSPIGMLLLANKSLRGENFQRDHGLETGVKPTHG